MPKTATISLRIDGDLKQRAQDVFDNMGLPMSLAIELFLKQVAEKERLPFKLGDEGPSAEELQETERRERDFWHAFMTWYFQVWPMFDSPEAAREAETEYGFTCSSVGSKAEKYISGNADGLAGMSDEQAAAYFDVSGMQILLSEAKELIYWALDMKRTFVPRLASAYHGELDKWRMSFVKRETRK